MVELRYLTASPHRYTFNSAPMRDFVLEYCKGQVLNLFAGYVKLPINEIRNDLDPDAPADYHMDALTFLEEWGGPLFDTVILDPPYSLRKSMECYNGRHISQFQKVKREVIKLLNPEAHVITLGYNSTGLGRVKGFDKIAVALVNHHGEHNDTIILVERMNGTRLYHYSVEATGIQVGDS